MKKERAASERHSAGIRHIYRSLRRDMGKVQAATFVSAFVLLIPDGTQHCLLLGNDLKLVHGAIQVLWEGDPHHCRMEKKGFY